MARVKVGGGADVGIQIIPANIFLKSDLPKVDVERFKGFDLDEDPPFAVIVGS